MKRLVLILAAASVAAAHGNTGAVSATLEDGAFNVSFANHAHETNSLWVVYDGFDYGFGTNGWGHVERLGTVTPETNTWTYAAPAGWGETVNAVRFILSEVPYDYDYSLDFIRSKSKERIVLSDFDFYMNYRVCMQGMIANKYTSNAALFTNRDGTGDVTPKFNLFTIGGTKWRFDYNGANGSQVSGATSNVFYRIEASSAGLYVNGGKINTLNGAAFTAASNGRFEFFCGNTTASTMGNAGAHISLYGAQIYDAPTGGNMLVNLVPMVKDGRPGMYDTVRSVYYYSDTGTDFDLSYGPSRVESADPFFASALCKAEATGPTVFSPASAITVSDSITNAYGGILNGTATLTLTGENDWGGNFSISNGTLVAAFGQGLGSNDCLRLRSDVNVVTGAYGGYGGWNGQATQSLGSGAGQVFVEPDGYYAWCAADGGALEVNVGGEGAPWTTTAARRRLLLNGAPGAGTLHFANPITIAEDVLIVRAGYGTVFFDQNVAIADDGTDPHSMYLYETTDNSKVLPDGTCVFRGKDNHFLNCRQYGGNYVMDEGTTNTIDGTLALHAGAAMTLLATNAAVKLTGANGAGGWLYVYGGKATFAGGTLEAGGFEVGENNSQSDYAARQPGLTFSGKVRLAGIGSNSYGSGVIRGAAASYALTLEDGADVEMHNLTFLRRQILHKGGTLKFKGNWGILRMGESGTARYHLYEGAELTAPGVGQDSNTTGVYTNTGTAEFVFRGGTLGTTAQTGSVFFRDFNANSSIYVASAYGGVFRADNATSITNGMKTSPSSLGTGATAWNHAAEDWLTAPAFKKTGSKRLTLSGTNTYACATDVAEGRLLLAGGENPGVLPTNGVVRVTGGTLDLGGNAQEVRGLVGTAGAVTNGALVVKEGIYPGGAGAVGSFACGATLDGTLHVDVDETGACDKLVAHGELDVSRIDLALPASLPAGIEKLQVVEGATAGAFRSVDNLPSGWGIVAKDTGLWAQRVAGTTVIFR